MYKNERVSVIMPVYNEERTVSEIIKRVLAQRAVDQLIIINDGSRDRSDAIIRSIAKREKRVKYISHSENRGKGNAVKAGLAAVDKGVIIIQDADLEYYPEDYPGLLAATAPDTAVFGTRTKGEHSGHHYQLARFANAFSTSLFNLLYSERISDLNTCYKVFRKEMLDGVKLKEEKFLLDMELSVTFSKKGYAIREVKIRYKGRTYDEGKKITVRDGIEQILYIITSRFTR